MLMHGIVHYIFIWQYKFDDGGGPGGAGGGSQMAGVPGVVELMQRTAMEASPHLLCLRRNGCRRR